MMIGRRSATVAAAACLTMPFIRPARAAQRLRLGISYGVIGNYGAAATTIANKVRGLTGGRIEIEIFPNSELGSEEAMLTAVRTGTLDLTIVASGLIGAAVPEIGLFDMPFLFRDADHARAVLDGPVGQEYAELAAAAKLPVLAWAENGIRHLTANRPIRNAAGLQGLKLRIMPAPILLDSFRAMGADAVTLSMTLVYEALRVGTVDAQENPIATILAAQLYQVQSYLMLTGHTYSAAGIVASPDLMEDLSPADRQALTEAARAGSTASRDFVNQSEPQTLAQLRTLGMAVITDIDRDSFRRAADRATAAASERFGADRLHRLQAA